MIETVVESIRVSLVTQHRVVILREVGGDRHLPIWIGRFEAEAIAMVLQGVDAARPLPYDLLTNVLGELDAKIEHIVVSDLNQDVFYASIILDRSGTTVQIDSRPSDAIAVAVRANVPILVEDSVMERAGITMGDEEDETAGTRSFEEAEGPIDEEGLSAFRDFIDTLDLDDFGRKRE
ncbi:bifunctional nuclease family protein [soil metagenome]